jgi:AcrR family transcriptional regulator
MVRKYRMRKRAEVQEQTREKIIRATMDLHDEQGITATTFADVASRAGVGQATVHRHFPAMAELVQTCGMHVWQEMRPPQPGDGEKLFAGEETRAGRLWRLVDEIDAFYRRGAHRLAVAYRERSAMAEIDGFLKAVEAGVEALVREALAGSDFREEMVKAAGALMRFSVWQELAGTGLAREQMLDLQHRLLETAIARPAASA